MLAIFPELLSLAKSMETVEKLTVAVRMFFMNTEGQKPNLKISNLIENIGINVEVQNLKHFGALVIQDEAGSIDAHMFLNGGVDALQQRFIQAHLLGHFFLHAQKKIADGSWKTGGFKEEINPVFRYAAKTPHENAAQSALGYQIEKDADTFAANLLMPRAMLLKVNEHFQNVSKVAQFFSVSTDVAAKRLANLGALKGPEQTLTLRVKSSGMERIRDIAKNSSKLTTKTSLDTK